MTWRRSSPTSSTAGELILFPARSRSARCSARPAAGRDSDDEHADSRSQAETDAPEAICGPRRLAATDPLPRKAPTARSRVGDDGQATRPAAAAPELERCCAACAALRPPGGAGGDRQRDRAALGTRRGPPGAARRGSRRPRPGDDPDAPPRVRAAGRQDLRRLGTGPLRDPGQDPARAPDAGMDRPRRGAVRLRPERDRQEPPRRSARSPRDRQRQDRRLAHARDARATAAPPPRRRQRQQSDRAS